jgi:hypothetical protein
VADDIDVSTYAGAPGQLILVQASDDMGVVSVHVRISDLQGVLLLVSRISFPCIPWFRSGAPRFC